MERPQSRHDIAEIGQEGEIMEEGYPSSEIEMVQRLPCYNEAEEISITLMEPELYRGATVGDIKIFENLLQDDQDIERVSNSVTPQMNTALHVAASFGQLQIVELVHKRCPSLVMRTNSRQDTALHHAARDGHLSVVKFLIKNVKGDIETGNMVASEGLLRMKNVDGNTALHEATINGYTMVAQLLIEEDEESANLVNNVGVSPLYLAAESGLSMLVTELLKLPIDHMIREKHEGKTALHAAIEQEHTETVKILIEHTPKLKEIRDNHGRTPLHYAAYTGYHQAVILLIEHNIWIAHHRDKDGMSPIHLASIKGHLTVFQELLKQCPDSRELLNNKSQNALHVASERGTENMVTFMLEMAELAKLINERDVDGNTLLHLATRHGHATIVSVLARHERVDLTVKNNEGYTAYEISEVHAVSSRFSVQKILSAAILKPVNALRRQRRLFLERHVQETAANGETTMAGYKGTLVIVATLVTTLTFASGFVIPGDHTKKGSQHVILNCAYHVYVISNSISMYSSIIAVILLIWAQFGDHNLFVLSLRWSRKLLAMALTMLAAAFAAGVYLVVNSANFSWLATTVLFMGFVYLVCIIGLFIPFDAPVFARYRWTTFMSRFGFNCLLFASVGRLGWLNEF